MGLKMLRLAGKLGMNLINKLFIYGDNFSARQVPLSLRQSGHASARHGLGGRARVADVGGGDVDGRLGRVGRHGRGPEAGVGHAGPVVLCHRVVGVVAMIQPCHGLVQPQSTLQPTGTRVHVESGHATMRW